MSDNTLIWSAWAPGIATQQEWQEWSQGGRAFDLIQKPDVSFIKPMVRRRLSSLAKMVFATSYQLIDEEQPALPLVFASRYGEMGKTVQLLTNLCHEEGLSPTSFGLSVHNSLVGMYGLIKKWTTSSTAIGAGTKTLSAGYIEAFSQSKAKNTPVLYFYYDEPLPEIYNQYREYDSVPICIGMLVDARQEQSVSVFEFLLEHSDINPLEFLKTIIK